MDDIFRSYIVPAIIAGIIALISVVLSAVVQYKCTKNMIKSENERLKTMMDNSRKENSKRLSVEYITNERIRWIQELRNTFADFRSHTTVVYFKIISGGKLDPAYSFEINREASYLKLLLKRYGDKECSISQKIDECIECVNNVAKSEMAYFDAMNELTSEVQNYLKVEWERVKIEIEGLKWSEDEEKKWREKLDQV